MVNGSERFTTVDSWERFTTVNGSERFTTVDSWERFTTADGSERLTTVDKGLPLQLKSRLTHWRLITF